MRITVTISHLVACTADKLAEELKISRSQLYVRALTEYLHRHSSSAITDRINEVLAEESLEMDPLLMRSQGQALSDSPW